MTFDMTETTKSKSDQLNGDDLFGSDITITITGMKKNSDVKQPVSVQFQGDNGKPYKPNLTMRRIMVAAWGKDAGKYVGNKMVLFRESTVEFGNLEVGGIQIDKLSNVTNPKKLLSKNGNKYSIVITKKRGKKELFEFEEMPNKPASAFDEAALFITTAKNLDELKDIWTKNSAAWKAAMGSEEYTKLGKRKDDKKEQIVKEQADAHDDDDIEVATADSKPDALQEVIEGQKPACENCKGSGVVDDGFVKGPCPDCQGG